MVRRVRAASPVVDFLAYTTDLITSSHLVEFSIPGGVVDVNLHTEVDFLAPALVFDAPTDSLFFPGSGFTKPGVHVFDASTGERLTSSVVSTPGPPQDMVLWGTPLESPHPASLELALHPGLLVTGSVGATYRIEYSLDLTNWVGVTQITLRESPFFWCDPTPANSRGKRFYRAAPVE